MEKNPILTIRDLYPNLNEKELAEAEDKLDRYLALVLRIFERMELEADPQVGQLTAGAGTVGSELPQEEPG